MPKFPWNKTTELPKKTTTELEEIINRNISGLGKIKIGKSEIDFSDYDFAKVESVPNKAAFEITLTPHYGDEEKKIKISQPELEKLFSDIKAFEGSQPKMKK